MNNYCIAQHLEPPEEELIMRNLPRQGENALAAAFNVREKYEIFFNSASGSFYLGKGRIFYK
ncbi:hypothetical protein NQ314_001364 [Rhamnusium bicolor]|uniref:Uncharacterized protein n=1 Tax=Rhamnusium bicolor TaxID=1586634 RepID=A0AAV8ZTS4_9CUCU|nr:hypothetical protein NQ314_001364 [Rhamnusium bicolor]